MQLKLPVVCQVPLGNWTCERHALGKPGELSVVAIEVGPEGIAHILTGER